MKPTEFVLWMTGFMDSCGDTPTPEQWAKLREKHDAAVGFLAAEKLLDTAEELRIQKEIDRIKYELMQQHQAIGTSTWRTLGTSTSSTWRTVAPSVWSTAVADTSSITAISGSDVLTGDEQAVFVGAGGGARGGTHSSFDQQLSELRGQLDEMKAKKYGT